MAGRCLSRREWDATQHPMVTDKVSVQGLKAISNSGTDAWGRPNPQPVQISVVLSLSHAVASAASTDSLDTSTIHYGNLGKLLLSRIAQHEATWLSRDDFAQILLLACLDATPSREMLSTIEVSVRYPKATRFGQGLSLELRHNPSLNIIYPMISLERLQLPALIGLNSHERQMAQMISISLWVDRTKPHISDQANEIEQLVAKTIEESSFGTLEALAESVAACIIKYFVLARIHIGEEILDFPTVKIKIEKPLAIAMADAASVEICRSADPNDPFGKRMAFELGNKRPQIPFPLQGRLTEFLQSWKQD